MCSIPAKRQAAVATILDLLKSYLKYIAEKSIDICLLSDELCDRFPKAVASLGVDSQQNRMLPGVCSLQGSGKFQGMRWDYAVVVIAGGDQRRRICHPTLYIV